MALSLYSCQRVPRIRVARASGTPVLSAMPPDNNIDVELLSEMAVETSEASTTSNGGGARDAMGRGTLIGSELNVLVA
jgi:hypothetical protein